MDLKVQISKRYKNTLSKRFNPKYAKYDDYVSLYYIRVKCPLCGVYKSYDGCGDCPFAKFDDSLHSGCFTWIEKIYKRKKRYWSIGVSFVELEDKTKAIKSLNWFRDRVEELIEWI